MRIIGGVAGGRKIETIAGRATRPTSDKVRAAIFNMMMGKIDGARVLDLFAGSGALGIEALSRNAAAAVFVEDAPKAIDVIIENLEALGFKDRAKIYRKKLPAAIKSIIIGEAPFDIVFSDPPYDTGLALASLAEIEISGGLKPGGWIAIEHSSREALPEERGSLAKIKEKKYGTTFVTIYERKIL